MAIVVIATFTPKPDMDQDLVELLKETAGAVHAEYGCQRWAVHAGGGQVVVIESWIDKDALRAHGEGTVLATLNNRAKHFLKEAMKINLLRPVPAGDDDKGSI